MSFEDAWYILQEQIFEIKIFHEFYPNKNFQAKNLQDYTLLIDSTYNIIFLWLIFLKISTICKIMKNLHVYLTKLNVTLHVIHDSHDYF